MNKAILISIQPQHAINILNGKKTLELRSWIPEGYKGWVYVYVVKPYPLLNYIDGKYELMDRKNHIIFHNIGMYEFYNDDIHLNGKVVFRFWVKEYDTYYHNEYTGDYRQLNSYVDGRLINATIDYDNLCLTEKQVNNYGDGKNLYAWHIKKLEVFDKPKELSEFRVKKAPQKMQYVYVKELDNE